MPLIRKDSGGQGLPAPTDDPIAALTSAAGAERWAAARALAGRADGIQPLAAALATETDARVREAIFTSLARSQSPESVTVILPYLRSADANIRAGALDTLRAMGPMAAPLCAALLADRDVDVRILACELTRNLPEAEAIRLLCALLTKDTEANVCTAAVDVLAEIGDDGVLPALKLCATRFPGNSFLEFCVKVAVERIGTDSLSSHG